MYVESINRSGIHFRQVFPTPSHIPDIGDIYVAQVPFQTTGGVKYECGDELLVICRTDEAPYNLRSSLGNLLIQGKDHKVTIWSIIEMMINQDILALKTTI